MEKTWIVVVDDKELGASLVFHVKDVETEVAALKVVKEEYERQNWTGFVQAKCKAYSIPKFRGKQNIVQICKVYPPAQEVKEDSHMGAPTVEFV
jgi:hypothetical protein